MPQQLTPKLYDPRWLIPPVKAALLIFFSSTAFTLVALKSDLSCRERKKRTNENCTKKKKYSFDGV